jgi:hypothetical protein
MPRVVRLHRHVESKRGRDHRNGLHTTTSQRLRAKRSIRISLTDADCAFPGKQEFYPSAF